MRNITRPQQFNMTFLSSIWSLISAAHFSYLTLSFHHSLSVLLSRSRQFCMMKFLNMKSFIKLLLVSSLKLFYEFTLTCHWLWNKAYPRGGLWARNITPQTQIKPPSSCRERVRWCSEWGMLDSYIYRPLCAWSFSSWSSSVSISCWCWIQFSLGLFTLLLTLG